MRERLGRAATGFAGGASAGLILENASTMFPQTVPLSVVFPVLLGLFCGAVFAVSRGSRR